MNFLAGACLGMAIGWFAGLAANPVVGSVIGMLASIALAFISLRSAPDRATLSRIAGFGLGCVVAATIGVYCRANNVFGLTPHRAFKQWTAIHVDEPALRTNLDKYLADQLGRGRSLSEITLLLPSTGNDVGTMKGTGEALKDDDQKPTPAHLSPYMLGLGAMFSLPKGPELLECIDQLEKKPSWEDAKNSYLHVRGAKKSDIAWIERANEPDADKVSALLVLLKAAQP